MKTCAISCLILSLLFVHPLSAELSFEVAWKEQSKDGFSGPNLLRDAATGQTLGIVVCDVANGVVCFAPDGKRLWEYPLKPPVTAYPAVGDIDGDGADDVVACDGQGSIVVLNAAGKLKWAARTPGNVHAESCPAIADLDGDGKLEILVGDLAGWLSCFEGTGKLRWAFRGEGEQIGPAAVADLYDTPGKEIIVTSHDGHIYALAAAGGWLWDIYRHDDLFPHSTPILADVDSDGVPDLYIGGGLHHFYRIDLRKPAIVLEENVLTHVNSAICATDVDGDGRDEIIFGNKAGGAWCYGNEGFRWKRELPAASLSMCPVALNLDGDPDLEVMFLFNRIHVFDGDGSTLLDAPDPGVANSPPLVGDFDNDGRMETILAGNGMFGSSGITCLKWNVPYREDPRAWTVFAANRAHTGRVPGAKDFQPLPTPRISDSSSPAGFSPHGDVRLFSGPNEWRFDVDNPQQQRLALLTDVVYPDGSVHRFASHVRGRRGRVVFGPDVHDAGTYQVTQKLVDADHLAVVSSGTTSLSFKGLPGDRAYTNDVLLKETADCLKAWRTTNPVAADALGTELLGLKGRLHQLSDAGGRPGWQSVASLRKSAARLRALAGAGRVLAATGSFFAWQYCPWAYFDSVESLPTPQDRTERLDVALCVGEYESLALNLTNVSPGTLDIRVLVGDPAGKKKFPADSHLEFRRAVTVPTIRGGQVADALPLLDQGRLVSVASMESEQLWLTVNANGLEPGDYVASLRLKSIEPDETEIIVPIHIKVYPLVLPRPRPLRFCVWALAASAPSYELKDLMDHGVTVHFGSAPRAKCDKNGRIIGDVDFAAHDASVKRLSQFGIMLFLSPQSGLQGQPFLSEPWRRAFVTYMRSWAAHMKELGIDYGDWALYPYDEPSTPYSQITLDLVEVAKLVRQADPNILIYTDPTSGTTMETVKMFTGLIDIWCPSAELLERLSDELVPEAKRVGKEVWFYDAAGRSRTLSCLGIYRWRFWYAWNMGFTGAGWWVYQHGDHSWEGMNPMAEYYCSVYRAPGAIVTSKRWEVAREGIEDYEILWLLRDTIQRAKQRNITDATVSDAEKLLAELPRNVEGVLLEVGRRLPLTPDGVPAYQRATDVVQDARRRIVHTCLRLNKLME